MNDIEIVKNTASTREDDLMARVIESGNIEGLERFIALREREEARQAALMFDRHFAEMQSEMPVVGRQTQGHGYKYATLEDIQLVCGPVIAKHGFSYTWREEATETGKRVIMTISGYGHSKESSFDVPPLTGTNRMNAVQVAGAMSTYGRRYSFVAGFGIALVGEDFDGVPQANPAAYEGDMASLRACGTLEELMACWQGIYTKHGGNSAAIRALTPVKDEVKAKL